MIGFDRADMIGQLGELDEYAQRVRRPFGRPALRARQEQRGDRGQYGDDQPGNRKERHATLEEPHMFFLRASDGAAKENP